MNGLVGVILSAGKGSRIDPFNADDPKPLLPIGNQPILLHHIQRLRALGVTETRIVVGWRKERLMAALGDGRSTGMHITYAEQQERLGIAHAVATVEPFVTGPMLLCLGDIFYATTRLQALVDRYARGDVAAVLAVMEDRDPVSLRKNFTVETGADGYVTRVVEKPRTPRSTLKGCGIYLFGPEIFDAIRRTPRTALRDEYEITSAIQILIDDGLRVAAEPVVDWDLNVTFPADLLAGNLYWLRSLGCDNLVDPTASVHAGARLTQTVIGAGAVVSAPAKLDQVLVLPGAVISSAEPLTRVIVGPTATVHCPA